MVDRIDVNRIGLLFLSIQAQDFIEELSCSQRR